MFSYRTERKKEHNFPIASASQEKGMVIRAESGIDIKFDESSTAAYKVVYNGDYVIHLRSFQGGYAFSKIRCACSPAYIILKPTDKLYYSFFKEYFMSGKFINSLRDVTYGIRDGRTISHDEWMKKSSFIPTINEQKQIVDFLDLINIRIETQNKIIEDLSTLKKGIIDSFFKNISNSTQLDNYLKERKTYSEKGEGYEHVTLSKDGICPKTDRYDRDFLVKSNNKNYKITRLNDICYNPANLKFRVICLNDYGDAIFSPIYVTFEVKNIDPYYLSLYLTSESFIKRILKYQQGTVYERMAVGPDDFCKGRIPNKSELEITSLKNFIAALDKKIKLERKILDNFATQKNYLSNNLFI